MRSSDFYTERVSYRSSALLRRLLFAAPLVTIASVLLASPALAATGLSPRLPNAVARHGHSALGLDSGICIAARPFFLLVRALLLPIIFRNWRKPLAPDSPQPQTPGTRGLDITWAMPPAVLLGVIGYFS